MSRIDTLTKTFHAYSAAFCTDPAAAKLNEGGKVLLPSSFLQDVTRASLVYPLQMLIQTRYRKFVYCGVLSFVAPEGQIIMPYWMLEHLNIEEGTVVQLQTCSLPKASIIKLRPHEKVFTDLHNPRAVLEASLSNHTCLTKGTTIPVHHVGQVFNIDVMEILGAHGNDERAVLVVDSDVKVEFERPLDMPPTPPRSPVQSPFNVNSGIIAGGHFPIASASSNNAVLGSVSAGVAAGGGFNFGTGAGYKPPTAGGAAGTSEPPKMPTLEPKFTAFKGTGRNLKGEVVTSPLGGTTSASGAASSTATLGGGATPVSGNPTPTSATPTPSPAPSLASGGAGGGGRALGSAAGGASNPVREAMERRMAAARLQQQQQQAAASATSPTAASSTAGTPPPSSEGGAEGSNGFVPFAGAGRRLKD